MKSKYVFARSIVPLDFVAEEYGIPPKTIEDTLDKFFSIGKDELMREVKPKRFLRIVKVGGEVILQLAKKRGRGFSVCDFPWFFVLKKEEAEEE